MRGTSRLPSSHSSARCSRSRVGAVDAIAQYPPVSAEPVPSMEPGTPARAEPSPERAPRRSRDPLPADPAPSPSPSPDTPTPHSPVRRIMPSFGPASGRTTCSDSGSSRSFDQPPEGGSPNHARTPASRPSSCSAAPLDRASGRRGRALRAAGWSEDRIREVYAPFILVGPASWIDSCMLLGRAGTIPPARRAGRALPVRAEVLAPRTARSRSAELLWPVRPLLPSATTTSALRGLGRSAFSEGRPCGDVSATAGHGARRSRVRRSYGRKAAIQMRP